MNPTPEQFLAALHRIEKLSPAPRVLGKALGLLRNVNSDIQQVEDLIRVDSALTAEFVRLANSFLFSGGGAQVSSLDRAIQRLGFKESIRVVNLSVARSVADRELVHYGLSADDYWSECLFNGLLMESLAHASASGPEHLDPSEAYTAGLLRFVGRLVINQILNDLGARLRWNGLTPLNEWERLQVGFAQEEIGKRLLEAWGLPPSIVEAIAAQHEPMLEPPSKPPLAEALAFCSLAQAHRAAFEGDDEMRDNWELVLSRNPFAKKHRITREGMNAVWGHSVRTLQEIRKSLRA